MVENFVVKDFICKKVICGDSNIWHYFLEKNCTIFHKYYEMNNHLVEVIVHENITFQNNISKISDYLIWLGTKCKDILIEYFNENMITEKIEKDKIIDDKWYKDLECNYIGIGINSKSVMTGSIVCKDRGKELNIRTYENEILGMYFI